MSTEPLPGTAEDAVSRLRILCEKKGWRITTQVRMPLVIHEYVPEKFGDKFVQRPEVEPLGSGELIAVDFGRMSPDEHLLLAISNPAEFRDLHRAGIRRLNQLTGVEGREVARQLDCCHATVLRFTAHSLVSPSYRRDPHAVRYTPILFRKKGVWMLGYEPARNETGPIAFFREDPTPAMTARQRTT